MLLYLICGLNECAAHAQSVSQTRLYPADGRQFGGALASSGNSLVVGDAYWSSAAHGTVGAAYVYTLSNGQFSQPVELTANDGQHYDLFGTSVASSGSTMAVGAPFHNGPGAVYVFTQNKKGWTQTQEIMPADGVAGDFFGCAVAMTANTLAIGAYRKGGLAGTVYLYTLKGSVWTPLPELTAPSSSSSTPAEFGFSLSLSGTSLLVGAPGLNSGTGAAYIYTSANGVWKLKATLAPNDATGGLYGTAVALSGVNAAIGSPATSTAYLYQFSGVGASAKWALLSELNSFENDGRTGFGAALTLSGNTLAVTQFNGFDRSAYVFTLQNNSWTPYTELFPFDTGFNGGFGTAVAILGNVVAVSRPYYALPSTISTPPVGMVYAFAVGPEVTPPDGAEGDGFGAAVAVSGTTVLSGAPGRNAGTGAVYAYTYAPGSLGAPTALTAADGNIGDNYGSALAFNGATLVIGAPGRNVGQGVIYLYTYTSGAWSLQAELTAKDGVAGDSFGDAVSLSGSTLVVGAPGKNDGQGAVYVFTLKAGVWSQKAELTTSDGQGGDSFGLTVSLSGNNLVIGAPYAATTIDFDTGAAYVFTLSGGQWKLVTKLTAPDGLFGDSFGMAVAVSGNQIVIGAPSHNADSGAVYPYTYSANGWMPQPELTTTNLLGVSPDGDQLGASLALTGSTLAAGAPGNDALKGAIHVYTSVNGIWTPAPGMYAGYGQPNDTFGSAVALSGNILAIGAPNANFGTGSLYTN